MPVHSLAKPLILIISLAVCLSTLEILFRLANVHPKFFKLQTGYVKFSNNNILGYELNTDNPEIDAYGIKKVPGKIFSKTKPPDNFRILVLGDSISFGCCGKHLKSDYSSKLEHLLKANSLLQNVEIINASVPGYNTIQEVEAYLSKHKALKPDYIILQVTLNDWMPKAFEYDDLMVALPQESKNIAHTFYSSTNKIPNIFFVSFLVQNIQYYFLRFQINNLVINYNGASSNILGEQTNNALIPYWKSTKIIEDGFLNLKKNLNEHERKNALVVLFPEFVPDLNAYPEIFTQEHAYIIDSATKAGFSILDLLSCYQKEFSTKHESFIDQPEDTVHPNDYGHQVAAECISTMLIPSLENLLSEANQK